MFGIETVDELIAVFKLYFSSKKQFEGNKKYCFDILDSVSRSFAQGIFSIILKKVILSY